MADKVQNENVIKFKARLAFEALFVPKAFQEGGEKKFSGKFLIPKTDVETIKTIRDAIGKVAVAKWGEKAGDTLKRLFNEDRLALGDGDKKDHWDGFAGHMFVSASNDTRPQLLNRDKSQVAQEDGVIYSGCYVVVHVTFWAQDNKFGKRINANLRGVQFFKDGDAFTGGGTSSVDEFEALDPVANTFAGTEADKSGADLW